MIAGKAPHITDGTQYIRLVCGTQAWITFAYYSSTTALNVEPHDMPKLLNRNHSTGRARLCYGTCSCKCKLNSQRRPPTCECVVRLDDIHFYKIKLLRTTSAIFTAHRLQTCRTGNGIPNYLIILPTHFLTYQFQADRYITTSRFSASSRLLLWI